jgi:hypothetical protein
MIQIKNWLACDDIRTHFCKQGGDKSKIHSTIRLDAKQARHCGLVSRFLFFTVSFFLSFSLSLFLSLFHPHGIAWQLQDAR